MSDPSVIIIGGGLAGLATGCYAQMNGYQCQVLEHGRHPGGVAAEWKRRGYTIDGGIHFVMSHKPGTALHETYRQLGLLTPDEIRANKDPVVMRFLAGDASAAADLGDSL